MNAPFLYYDLLPDQKEPPPTLLLEPEEDPELEEESSSLRGVLVTSLCRKYSRLVVTCRLPAFT